MRKRRQKLARTKSVPTLDSQQLAGRPRGQRISAEPRVVAKTVDFKELMLHQVVSFSTRFVQHVVATYVSQHSITLPELRALFLLGRYGKLAPIRIAELATTDRATATRAVHALRQRNLVRVCSDTSHHKRTFASLTTAGVELHDQLAKLANYRNEWLKERFTAEELSTLFALLQRLEALARSLPTQLPTNERKD